MTSLPPENAPQLGTCPTCGSNARYSFDIGTLKIGESKGPFPPCADPWHETAHSKPVAAPENQPRPTSPAKTIGEFLRHDSDTCPCQTCEQFRADYPPREEDKWPIQKLNEPEDDAYRRWKIGEAQGEAPQAVKMWMREAVKYILHDTSVYADPSERYEALARHIADCMPKARLEPGAHPPPDEELVIEIARELYDRFMMGGWEPQDAYQQIREWIERARAPQPETVKAPVAPPKLSAQEWLDKEFPSSAQSSMLERSFACRVAEAYAREYVSSSNAALRDELSKAKQIIHVNVGGQIYERLLEALKMLEPLDEPGQPNTLVALVGKALERMRESESKVSALEGQLRELLGRGKDAE